jgi:hypothetical protein
MAAVSVLVPALVQAKRLKNLNCVGVSAPSPCLDTLACGRNVQTCTCLDKIAATVHIGAIE